MSVAALSAALSSRVDPLAKPVSDSSPVIPVIFRYDVASKRPTSKAVTEIYLPEDYKVLPHAYFNRFILFSGYYDLGLIGALISSLLFGMFYGWIWRKVKKKVQKINLLWPVFLYMPIPAIATYFIAVGGIAYGLINSLVPIGLVFFIIILSRLKVPKKYFVL